MIRDFNMDYLEKRVYLPAQLFQTFITGAGISTGTPVFQQIAATGITGIRVNAANDAINTLWQPWDVDIKHAIRFRVWASSTGTATGDTFKVLYTAILASGTTLIQPATALDTVIAANGAFVANTPVASPFGVLKRGTIADTTEFLALKVSSDMAGSASNASSILGLEIRYTPRKMVGPRRNIVGGKRLDVTRPLGVIWQNTAQEGL